MTQQTAAATHPATLDGARPGWSEDWLAVAGGLIVFALALAFLSGNDLLGWATAPRTWLEIGKSVRPASQAYSQSGLTVLLLATFAFVLALMAIAALLLQRSVARFIASFTIVFWLSYLCWVL